MAFSWTSSGTTRAHIKTGLCAPQSSLPEAPCGHGEVVQNLVSNCIALGRNNVNATLGPWSVDDAKSQLFFSDKIASAEYRARFLAKTGMATMILLISTIIIAVPDGIENAWKSLASDNYLYHRYCHHSKYKSKTKTAIILLTQCRNIDH